MGKTSQAPSVTVTEIVSGTKTSKEFSYAEIRKHGLNRSIKIWNADRQEMQYQFKPNPHDNRDYNKNNAKFYLQAAKEIGKKFLNNNNTFPPFNTKITALGVEYELV